MEIEHVPVLLQEVIDAVPHDVKITVDGTLGYGGHTSAIIEKYPNLQQAYGFDIDPYIFEKTKKKLTENSEIENKFIGKNLSYTTIKSILDEENEKADFVLLDLGVNMEHFKNLSRGFSIQGNEILDMRFDPKTNDSSAQTIVNTYSKDQLSQIFQKYADFSEKKADEIAQNIVKSRREKKITHTQDLKDILSNSGLGFKASVVIFQALRIETNKEMTNVEIALETIPHVLAPGGVFAIITFHSIEDRLVKQRFKHWAKQDGFELVQKKAIQPHYTEKQKNRASRSAKLRLLKKL